MRIASPRAVLAALLAVLATAALADDSKLSEGLNALNALSRQSQEFRKWVRYQTRSMPRLRVIIIGNSNYQEIDRVSSPKLSAELIGQTFRELAEAKRIELVSMDVVLDATKTDILGVKNHIASLLSDEQVVIFFAGRTHFEKLAANGEEKLLLLPVDARNASSRSTYNADTLENVVDFETELMSGFKAEDSVLFVADGCNIGEAIVGKVARRFKNLSVLTSAKVDETALDWDLRPGVFASQIALGLGSSGQDLDADGLLSLDEIYVQIYPGVAQAAGDFGAGQHPALFGRYSHKAMLALAMVKEEHAGERVKLAVSSELAGAIKSASRVTVNGQDLRFSIEDDSLEMDASEQGKLRPGVNTLGLFGDGIDAKVELIFRDQEHLETFAVPYKKVTRSSLRSTPTTEPMPTAPWHRRSSSH